MLTGSSEWVSAGGYSGRLYTEAPETKRCFSSVPISLVLSGEARGKERGLSSGAVLWHPQCGTGETSGCVVALLLPSGQTRLAERDARDLSILQTFTCFRMLQLEVDCVAR